MPRGYSRAAWILRSDAPRRESFQLQPYKRANLIGARRVNARERRTKSWIIDFGHFQAHGTIRLHAARLVQIPGVRRVREASEALRSPPGQVGAAGHPGGAEAPNVLDVNAAPDDKHHSSRGDARVPLLATCRSLDASRDARDTPPSERHQPPPGRGRDCWFVAGGELSRGLPLGRVADWKQKPGSATAEPVRCLGLPGCSSEGIGSRRRSSCSGTGARSRSSRTFAPPARC